MLKADPTEPDTIGRAQRGDQAAYTDLVRRYQDRVHRFVLRMVGSREEALELTQEAFIKAWQALPEWRPQAAFSTWLFRIASNLAMDALRRRKTVQFVPLDEEVEIAESAPAPDAQLLSKQRLRVLEQALAGLPAEQREVILLRDIEDMSYTEMAGALGINEGTVKSRLARGRAALTNAFRRMDE